MTAIVEHRADAPAPTPGAGSTGLRNYYLLRALVAAAWVAAAFAIGGTSWLAGAILLIAYPAWDALANLGDAARNGGLARNPSQALNVAVSTVTAAAVAATITDMKTVIGIFGAWAILAGLLQLATGVRRWKTYGAQWAMILSGAQSALAGGHFLSRALGSAVPDVRVVAPYAAFGAFYFLLSALLLSFRRKG
ncbi:DUF308 domain-containing protein [Sphingomonas sp. HITSZ_GF]|uniref:DUF308 domain-containing protein n=1 Tax=Sphingomonas sp. HITSZ_GF TaxID=3037247 RepID=UPI00240E8873|nr:DUF308 domain-containing protein [Sphingomonas sp. HITSZ_GF]MDG2535696.1 DUF308 domain-containing protein [Sphingomonas sp. HITSZ_GF]